MVTRASPPPGQERVTRETALRMRLYPQRCPIRVMAEVILDLEPDRESVEIERHICRESCPSVLRRETYRANPRRNR